MTDLPRFGRYATVRKLGGGAAGDVYRAHDELLGRDVAIKTVKAAGRHAVLSLERFFHEARAVAALSHPGVIRIFDMGEQDGTPYLVMELATGGSLADRLQTGRLGVDEACAVGVAIASALAAAHARGIVHRDVKPGNIVCDDEGAWRLADFGVAHVPDSTLTLAGQFLGSPAYSAPESLEAGQFGAASDVYGLAATLHEALVGSPPWGEMDYAAILDALNDGVPSIAAKVPGLPPPVAAILDRALAREPKDRPTAQQLAAALAPANPSITMTTVVASAPIPRRTLVIAGAAAIVVVGLVAALASRGGHGAATPAAPPVVDERGTPRPVVEDADADAVDEEASEHVVKAQEKMERRDWKGAERELRKALEEDPDDRLARAYLDSLREAMGAAGDEHGPPGHGKKPKKPKKGED